MLGCNRGSVEHNTRKILFLNTFKYSRKWLIIGRLKYKPRAVWKQVSDDVAGFLFFKSGAFFAKSNRSLRYASSPEPKTRRHIWCPTCLWTRTPNGPIRGLAVSGHNAWLECPRAVVKGTKTKNKKTNKLGMSGARKTYSNISTLPKSADDSNLELKAHSENMFYEINAINCSSTATI